MSRRALALALAAAAALTTAAPAAAAPPPNDGPQAPVDLAPYTAENGTPQEVQGDADLAEATADAGVPRCLGRASFARTVWFRLPPADVPRRVRIAAPTKAGEPAELTDLAVFVQPPGGANTREPQACDGPEARDDDAVLDGAPTVVLDLAAGQSVLVQAGWPAGATANGLTVTALAKELPVLTAPSGDVATRAPRLASGRVGRLTLAGARLSGEDPAQPACPAAATVWRKVEVRQGGRQTAVATGGSVMALTAFRRLTGTGAAACVVRAAEPLVRTRFRARRGRTVWLRVGTDDATPGRARLALSGPCERRPLEPAARTRGRIAGVRRSRRIVRVRLADGCLKRATVTVRRGSRVIARASRKRLGPGATGIRVRGARLPGSGRLRVRVTGRDALRRGRTTRIGAVV